MRIASGVSDQYIYFRAVQASDNVTTDTGSNGKMFAKRTRNGGSLTDFTTPTITRLDTGAGIYALLLDEDTTIAAGNFSEEMCIRIGDTGGTMAAVVRVIELFRPPGGDTGQLNVNVVSFSDTGINARLPASLVGGRMDANVGAVGGDTGVVTDTGYSNPNKATLAENYAADGSPPTLEQALMLIQQKLCSFSIVGTTLTVHTLNDTGTAAVFTLDSATAPTSITRTG